MRTRRKKFLSCWTSGWYLLIFLRQSQITKSKRTNQSFLRLIQVFLFRSAISSSRLPPELDIHLSFVYRLGAIQCTLILSFKKKKKTLSEEEKHQDVYWSNMIGFNGVWWYRRPSELSLSNPTCIFLGASIKQKRCQDCMGFSGNYPQGICRILSFYKILKWYRLPCHAGLRPEQLKRDIWSLRWF